MYVFVPKALDKASAVLPRCGRCWGSLVCRPGPSPYNEGRFKKLNTQLAWQPINVTSDDTAYVASNVKYPCGVGSFLVKRRPCQRCVVELAVAGGTCREQENDEENHTPHRVV